MGSYSKLTAYLLLCIFLHIIDSTGANNECECYLLGTLSSVDGTSMCDNKTFQCKCHKNVIGKNCDHCQEGFYNILSGRGCSRCNCSPLGSLKKSCDSITGKCLCKPGFTGFQCDQCGLNMYKFSMENCLSCNCNPYGSKGLQCNMMGQCQCLTHAEGKHCDRCKENTYNLQQSCIPCPPCYEYVQSALKKSIKFLNTLERTIEEAANNIPSLTQNYRHFKNEMMLLKAKIYKLKMEYDYETLSAEETIDMLTKEAQDFDDEIQNFIKQLDNDPYKKKMINALYVGRTNLKEANDLVNVCEDTLANATKVSKRLNRHSKTITLIAENALRAAKTIEEEAETLQQLSLNADSTCKEACELAEGFIEIQQTLDNEIQDIKDDISTTGKGIETTKTYTKSFQRATNVLAKDAVQLDEEVITLTIHSSEALTDHLKEMNGDLTSITAEIQSLIEEADKWKEIEKSTESKIEKLEEKQEDVVDSFLVVQLYKERAEVAVNKSNNVFKSTQESLQNLEKFQQMQQEVNAALENVTNIQNKVDAVLNNSGEIINICDQLTETVKDMDKLYENLTNVYGSNRDNQAHNQKILILFEELEEEYNKLVLKLKKSHNELQAVKRNLKNLQNDYFEKERIIKRMQEYIIILETLPTTDEQMDEVEREIEEIEVIVSTAEYLIDEKKKLQKEVENVKDIIESLPIEDSSLCESAKNEPKN